MSDGDDEVTMSVETLATLLYKAKTVGWEVARGFHTDDSAKQYLRGLVYELTGARGVL